MKDRAKALFVLALLSVAVPTWAYEVRTHEELSAAAVTKSALSTSVPATLGLEPLPDAQRFPNSKGIQRTVIELFRDGARFEDDDSRPLNHFYDPYLNRGLFVFGKARGHKSPDWSLEDPETIVEQENSFEDARQYFYQALTLPIEVERNKNWGMTFQTLGHVIHHLQDMAQPQHVRNDPHCDATFPCRIPGALFGLYSPSFYEKYTDELLTQLPLSTDNGYEKPVSFSNVRDFWHTEDGKGMADYTNRGFVSGGTNFDKTTAPNAYPTPNYYLAQEWEANANDLLQQAGLPIPDECKGDAPCVMTFYRSDVYDRYRATASGINEKTSTWSIFDHELKLHKNTFTRTDPDTGQPYTSNQLFSLNRFNVEDAHKFLIPRAVAYSAGLIDYFFRGKLEAIDASYVSGGIRLRVKNAITDPALENEVMYSADSAVVMTQKYKDIDGLTKVFVSPSISLAQGLSPGQTSQSYYVFSLPTIPSSAVDVEYRLVFRGKLGEEEGAVAVGEVDPSSGFAFQPNYLPVDGIGGNRVIHKSDNNWVLASDRNNLTGNIDWKGWYQDGKPTRVLSWMGPKSRYFSSSVYPEEFGPNIFQNGELFAVAPLPVLGAALMKDSEGSEWLVAICLDHGWTTDVVFRKPNKKSASPALYDPTTAVDGWQQIGKFAPENGRGYANVPWFFNGDGTEAQTMRNAERPVGGDIKEMLFDNDNYTVVSAAPWKTRHLDRLKIEIADRVATISNPRNGTISRDSSVLYDRRVDCVQNCTEAEWKAVKPICYWVGAGVEKYKEAAADGPIYETIWRPKAEYVEAQQGSYVVAVDYQDSRQVLAEHIIDKKESDLMETYYHNYQIICSANEGNRLSFQVPSGHTSWWKHKYSSKVNNRLRVADKEYSLETYDFDIESLTTDLIWESGHFQRNQDFHSPTTKRRLIQYLDLRNDTVLYSEESRSYYKVAEPQSPADVPKMGYDKVTTYALQHGNTRHQLVERSFVGINSDWYFDPEVYPPVLDWYDRQTDTWSPVSMFTTDNLTGVFGYPVVPVRKGIRSRLYFGHIEMPSYLSTSGFTGGIAFDAEGNIFASLEYRDKDDQVRYFNYLSGGDLQTLIPLAPENAHYYPVGVIK